MSHRESESDDHQDDRFSESERGGSSGDGDASEEDEGRTAWKNIQFADISVGEQIGGGGFAIVYKGTYRNKNVALKTMVSTYEPSCVAHDIYIIYYSEASPMLKKQNKKANKE